MIDAKCHYSIFNSCYSIFTAITFNVVEKPAMNNCFVVDTHAMNKCYVVETHAMRLYDNDRIAFFFTQEHPSPPLDFALGNNYQITKLSNPRNIVWFFSYVQTVLIKHNQHET